MKTSKRVLFIVIALLLMIQLFRPAKNYAPQASPNDIAEKYVVPMNVLMDLNTACYNCHSNYTTYPWYFHIQPVGWWMNGHIEEAKKHVNFSEFALYPPDQAKKKFHAIYEVMRDHTMPIDSYLWMHKEAHLTDEQYRQVADWAKQMSEHPQLVTNSTE
ncbi:MAG: heme-binding domain-containing protein [Thermoflavifilum sp.]|nr:heme-binding domain-containing protein [Thermoflavifilum sp.]